MIPAKLFFIALFIFIDISFSWQQDFKFAGWLSQDILVVFFSKIHNFQFANISNLCYIIESVVY